VKRAPRFAGKRVSSLAEQVKRLSGLRVSSYCQRGEQFSGTGGVEPAIIGLDDFAWFSNPLPR